MRMYTRRRNNGEEKYTGPIAIGTLFEKYRKRLRPPQSTVISTFCALVAAEVGVILTPAQVRYNVHLRLVNVTTLGPQKSEILFNKARILELCREALGPQGTPEHIV